MGITSIKMFDFTLGNLGIIPGCFAFVFIGTTISDLADAARGEAENSTLMIVLLVVGSVLACSGVCWVSVVARRKLKA